MLTHQFLNALVVCAKALLHCYLETLSDLAKGGSELLVLGF
jgi:hypothetical protein